MKSTDVILLIGKRGRGKSTLARSLIMQAPRYIVYDGATHQHGELGQVIKTLEEFNPHSPGNVVYQPDQDSPESFDEFCKKLWDSRATNFVLMVEEVSFYSESNPDFFNQIVKVGRNRGIGLLGITQFPKRMGSFLPRLADHWFIFQLDHPYDLDFVAQYLPPELVEQIRTLPPYEFVHYSSEGTFARHDPITPIEAQRNSKGSGEGVEPKVSENTEDLYT